jgi:hypothetical protein
VTTSAGTSSDVSIANTRWIPSIGMSAISSPVIAKRIARKSHNPPSTTPTTAKNPPMSLAPLKSWKRAAIASTSTFATGQHERGDREREQCDVQNEDVVELRSEREVRVVVDRVREHAEPDRLRGLRAEPREHERSDQDGNGDREGRQIPSSERLPRPGAIGVQAVDPQPGRRCDHHQGRDRDGESERVSAGPASGV